MPEADDIVYGRTVKQVMDLFIMPEIRRRQDSGKLPTPVALQGFQVVFFLDGRRPEVRLNEEVHARALLKMTPGKARKVGDPVFCDEVDGIELVDLPEEEQDCGHMTYVRIGQRWIFAFNTIYNRSTARRHVEAARRFYDTAQNSFANGHLDVFVDNLFSAAELAAKGRLLCWLPDAQFAKKASHKAVLSKFHQYSHEGEAPPLHSSVLAKLHSLRGDVRYLKKPFSLTSAEAQEFSEVVKKMIDDAAEQLRMS